MVDAQTALRAADAGGILIGSNSSHERADKTGRFVDTAHAFDARLLNTWEENSAPVDVCRAHVALCEGLGRSFTLTLLEVGAEDACAIASHQTIRRSEESKFKTASTCGTL